VSRRGRRSVRSRISLRLSIARIGCLSPTKITGRSRRPAACIVAKNTGSIAARSGPAAAAAHQSGALCTPKQVARWRNASLTGAPTAKPAPPPLGNATSERVDSDEIRHLTRIKAGFRHTQPSVLPPLVSRPAIAAVLAVEICVTRRETQISRSASPQRCRARGRRARTAAGAG